MLAKDQATLLLLLTFSDAPYNFSSPQHFLSQLHRVTHDLGTLVRGIQSYMSKDHEEMDKVLPMRMGAVHRSFLATSDFSRPSTFNGATVLLSVPLAPSIPHQPLPQTLPFQTPASDHACGTRLSCQVSTLHISLRYILPFGPDLSKYFFLLKEEFPDISLCSSFVHSA
jgi:hypothetical protein